MVLLNRDPLPSDPKILDQITPTPTNLESDEPPLETDLHREQIDLLIRLLKYWWRAGQIKAPQGYRPDFYISGNLTVYYNPDQIKSRDFRGPDIFVVLGAEPSDRKSWVVWEEDHKFPDVVIELLSDSTAAVDRGEKKELYQNLWHVANYFWFHPHTLEFAGFRLEDNVYQPIPSTTEGWLWSDQLQLYLGIDQQKLRWFTATGDLIPLPEDQERLARERAEEREQQERLAKEHALKRVQELEDYLRSQGLHPNP